MRRSAVALGLASATLAAAGCGSGAPPPSALCTEGEQPMTRALQRAPGRVALADGTLWSDCVARARDAGELQNVGFVITGVADRLADRALRDGRAALRLGFLIGAAERGAAHSNGIHADLVRRLEATARRVPAGNEALVERGRRAERRRG